MIGSILSGPRVLKVSFAGRESQQPVNPPSPRGVVKGLSRESGRALQTQLAFMQWPFSIHHGTFTFPDSFPSEVEGVTRCQRALSMRLQRAGFFGFWRLEFQERGAPHWHVLVCQLQDNPWATEEALRCLSAWWSKYTQNPTRFGCHWRAADNGAEWYLACHQAKDSYQSTWPEWYRGRAWGFIAREEVERWQEKRPMMESGYISDSEWIWYRRILRRFVEGRARRRGKRFKLRQNPHAQGSTWFLPERHHVPLLQLCTDLGASRDHRRARASFDLLTEDGELYMRVSVSRQG